MWYISFDNQLWWHKANLPIVGSCSCGSCGYALNLTSSNRITPGVSTDYSKSIKKGVISFHSVDLSRFTQVDEVNCLPLFWGRYRTRTKLLCRNCGVLIGCGYGESTVLCGSEPPSSSSLTCQKYRIKIRALQLTEQWQDRFLSYLVLVRLSWSQV